MSQFPPSGPLQKRTTGPHPQELGASSIQPRKRSVIEQKKIEKANAQRGIEASGCRPDLPASPRPALTPTRPGQRTVTGALGRKRNQLSDLADEQEWLAKQRHEAKARKDAQKVEKRKKKAAKEDEKRAISGAKRGTVPAGNERARPSEKRAKLVSFASPPQPLKSGSRNPKVAETDPRRSSQ